MCTGFEWFMVAATTATAASAMSRGEQEQELMEARANEQTRQADALIAEQEKRAARDQENAEAAAARTLEEGEFAASQTHADAVAEREAAELRAGRIRRGAGSERRDTKAAFAASGVDASRGTAATVDAAIVRNSEEDALNEILYGTRRADRLDQDAALIRQKAGRDAEMLRKYGKDARLQAAESGRDILASSRASAGLSRRAGENAATAGTLNAFGSVMSGGAEIARGWKRRRDTSGDFSMSDDSGFTTFDSPTQIA